MYDYIRRAYGRDYKPGQRVKHNESSKLPLGTVAPEDVGQGHHVMVRFDGRDHADPCHPDALDLVEEQSPVKAERISE